MRPVLRDQGSWSIGGIVVSIAAFLRGQGRSATGIGSSGRRKKVLQLKDPGSSSWCSRDRTQLQRPCLGRQGKTQSQEHCRAGRNSGEGLLQTRWPAGTKQRALIMGQAASSGWAQQS